MQNRYLVLSQNGLVRLAAACSVAVLGLAAGCSSTAAGGGGSGLAGGDTSGGDAGLTGDTGSSDSGSTDSVDVIVPNDTGADATAPKDAAQPGDTSGQTDIPADAVSNPDSGPSDTGPADTGPADTGPVDTGPTDTGTTTDVSQSGGPVWGTDNTSGSVQKVVTLAFGAKTDGCDLNGDGTVDNTMAGLGGIIGSKLQDAVNADSVDMLFDPKSYNTTGTPFQFNVLLGAPTAGSTCKNPSAGCEFTVKPSSYTNDTCDATSCTSKVSFPDATINGSALKASADKFEITLSLSGAPLTLTISKVQLSGTVADSASWKTTTNGLLCGYVTDTDLNAAIDALPASALSSFGGAATVKGLLPMLAPSDIASTPGGPKDAKSLGLKLATVSATITSLTP